MPTYKLKDWAVNWKVSKLDSYSISDVVGKLLDASTSGPRALYPIDGTAAEPRELLGFVEYAKDIFGMTDEEAKLGVVDRFLSMGLVPVGTGIKILRIPNIGCCYDNGVFPLVWRAVRRDSHGESPGPETLLRDIMIQGQTGDTFGDDTYLTWNIWEYPFESLIPIWESLTWGQLKAQGADALFDFLEDVLQEMAPEKDVQPGNVPSCHVDTIEVPFTQQDGWAYLGFPDIVCFIGQDDNYTAVQFRGPIEGRNYAQVDTDYQFAGAIVMMGENAEVKDSDGVIGFYSGMCTIDLVEADPSINGTTLEDLYMKYPEVREYIEVIPDPEPEKKGGLEATIKNKIIVK